MVVTRKQQGTLAGTCISGEDLTGVCWEPFCISFDYSGRPLATPACLPTFGHLCFRPSNLGCFLPKPGECRLFIAPPDRLALRVLSLREPGCEYFKVMFWVIRAKDEKALWRESRCWLAGTRRTITTATPSNASLPSTTPTSLASIPGTPTFRAQGCKGGVAATSRGSRLGWATLRINLYIIDLENKRLQSILSTERILMSMCTER